MIHLDGPPGSGASHLAARLAADLHFRVEKRAPKGEKLDALLRAELTASPQAVVLHGYRTVHACARALNSRAYRAPLDGWELALLDRAALAQGAVQIYCAARREEVETLADPKSQRDDFTRTLCAQAERLLAAYDEELATCRLPLVRLDGPRLQEADYQKLLAWLRAELWRQRPTVLHHQEHRSSGPVYQPPVALVGDRYPEGGHDLRDQPGARAFLRASGASWTLHRALTAAGLTDAYLCNWHRTGDEVADLCQLRLELETVHPQAVVALGGAAGRALRKLKIPHTELPHPAHQRRFNAGGFGYYVKQLALAATEAPTWPPVHLLADV